jgi:hypothetical protein
MRKSAYSGISAATDTWINPGLPGICAGVYWPVHSGDAHFNHGDIMSKSQDSKKDVKKKPAKTVKEKKEAKKVKKEALKKQ